MKDKRFCAYCGAALCSAFRDGRVRQVCDACSSVFYENPVPATAAVVIRGSKVLLVKRGVEPQKGKWSLPGGYLELDEEPGSGCLRELEEETGLRGVTEFCAGAFLSPNPLYKNVALIGFSVKSECGEPVAGDDSDEARFFDIDSMPELAFKSHIKVFREVLLRRGIKQREKNGLFSGAYVITSGDHCLIAQNACRGGAEVIQYRDKHSERKVILENAYKIREITKKFNTLFIMNDYIDIAMMAQADGVHLGQNDFSVSEARKIVPDGFIIGKSTHSVEQALEAEEQGADYIGIGPVFKTPTKETYVPIGLDVLSEVVRRVHIPLVAIGGLDMSNVESVINRGAGACAMVREFRDNTEQTVRELNKRFLNGK